jgi:hypothetical protein
MENGQIISDFRKVSIEKARKEVRDYLKEKQKMTKYTNVMEVSQDLKIRADLVEDILEEFVKQGKGKFTS